MRRRGRASFPSITEYRGTCTVATALRSPHGLCRAQTVCSYELEVTQCKRSSHTLANALANGVAWGQLLDSGRKPRSVEGTPFERYGVACRRISHQSSTLFSESLVLTTVRPSQAKRSEGVPVWGPCRPINRLFDDCTNCTVGLLEIEGPAHGCLMRSLAMSLRLSRWKLSIRCPPFKLQHGVMV